MAHSLTTKRDNCALPFKVSNAWKQPYSEL
jgi:hypothetical protein